VSTLCVIDADLVARARDGDEAAFGELVDRHRTAVYRAAMAALGTHAEADDAAQDTFVLAWRRLGSFRGDASFRTWLLAIAWHQAINRRRGLMKWWKRTVPFEDHIGDSQARSKPALSARPWTGSGRAVEGPDPTYVKVDATYAKQDPTHTYVGAAFRRTVDPDPEQLASGQELRRDIAKAIRSLTPKLRDALLLAQSGDYSYEDIGTMVKSPVGTIKWRVAEARRLVRKQLQKLGHAELG
jgi:RNA polymerase sigma-70 factor (ECF subfamily)